MKLKREFPICSRCFLWACTLCLAGLLAAGQDRPARFRVSTNLITVDVRVLDSKGRPITGLTADDFMLFEEGVPQAITYFQEISLPLTSSRVDMPPRQPAAARAERSGPPAVSAPLASDKRQLILLFNFSSAGLQETETMKRAARAFLNTQFNRDDSAAVLVFDNGLEMLTDFTSDHSTLGRAIDELTTGNPELDVSLPDEEAESESDTEETDSDFLADETEFALFETNQQLSAIQSVADSFRDVPGRKALVYFSSGLTSRGIENDEQMRLTTDLCNRSNISVYSVDARGLVAFSPGGGAHRSGGGGTGIYNGRAALNQLVSLNQSQEGLMTLAADTGGSALVDDNDLGKIFQKAREDASHYYLIGYHVPAPPKDGRFRRIEVRTRIRYPTVEYRRGYFADKPYRILSTSEKEFQFLQAVIEDEPKNDFPLKISAEYFPDAGSQYQVPILLAFDYSELSLLSGARDLNLEVIILARNTRGISQAGERDRVEIRAGRGNDTRTRFVYQNLLVLDPGRYRLTAYVRDNRSGMMSLASCDLELKPLGQVRLSSLVAAGSWKQPDAETGYKIKSGKHVTLVQNPLEIRGRILIPRVDARFTPAESIYLHGRVKIEGAAVSSGRYRVVLTDGAQERIHEGSWRRLSSDEKGFLNVSARMPLQALEPGNYQLVVELRLNEEITRSLTKTFQVIR